MEKFVASFVVLGALLAAIVSVAEAQTVNKYFKDGGELQLSPQKVSGPIDSIVWKYDKNLLAEWARGTIELTYYNRYQGRSLLNTVTGVLVVKNMTAVDTGLYSVEVNNKVQSQTYQIVKIDEVPEPTVQPQPLACGPTAASCRLKCDGDVSQAGPVTYSWKKDSGDWEQSVNITEIFNNEKTVATVTCKMENPVSQKESKPCPNMFYSPPPVVTGGGTIVGIIVGVLVPLGAVFVGFVYWRKLLCFQNRDMMAVDTKGNEMTEETSSPAANGEAGDKGV